MKYALAVIKNLFVLYIAIAIFAKADNDFAKIVLSLLVMIYLSIESFRLWLGITVAVGNLAYAAEFLRIKGLLKGNRISNTTLNPVVSEEDIAAKKEEERKWGRKSDSLFNELIEREKEEVKAHQEAGKGNQTFQPSSSLLRIVREEAEAIAIRNVAHEDCEKMIKANLAVLNGKPIEEIRNGCKLHMNGILGLTKGEYDSEEFLKRRKEYWRDCWDDIPTHEGFRFPEYEDPKDEEEKKFAEAEKGIDRAWIRVYIESGFLSIIFFVALWHLLRGLQLF